MEVLTEILDFPFFPSNIAMFYQTFLSLFLKQILGKIEVYFFFLILVCNADLRSPN